MPAQDIVVARWTPEVLLAIWGFAQALIFEYVPYVKDWYIKLDEQWKRFVQAIGLLLVSIIVVVLACYDIVGGIACDRGGFIDVLIVWLLGLAVNQTTHLVFKKKAPE